MSSGIENKMYNLEVMPPAAVWEKIAEELDESALSLQFSSRLHTIEINPPTRVWQSIAASLDEPLLENDFAEKLTNIHITPPSAVWNKITNSLDAENETPLFKQRKISPLLKYAAAAVITGFLAWGGVQLLTKNSEINDTSKQAIIQSNSVTETAAIIPTLDENIALKDITASLEEARNDAALEASKKTFARLDNTTASSKIKNAADFYFVTDNFEPTETRGFNTDPIATPSVDITNRYIMLMTPDGNIIRMSKKLRELVCCVSGEDQDKDCLDQMKKWRENIGNPSAIHSSSNFIDVLDIIKCMQEN